MEEILVNEYQTPIKDLHLELENEEIRELFYDFINNVPYIKSLISVNRPRAKDLKRDEEGKIIIDITLPHILEDMDYFRPSAIHFLKYGCYTNLRPNSNPNSEYGKWIREEIRRCWYGYVRPSDGEWITGDYYFFLNYCPILLSKKSDKGNFANRVNGFPSVWEGHYYKFHYLQLARNNGKHATELASRSKGKSLCAAAMLAKRFILGENEEVRQRVVSYIVAFDTAKLKGGDLTLDKFQYIIDFCSNNTQFPNKRLVNAYQNMQWQMGYVDLNNGTKKGTLNAVVGKSYSDSSKLRGSRGVLYLFEEAGSFTNLLESYNNLRPSVEEGDDVFGMLYLFGTTGDDLSDFSSMQEIMYHPKGYNVYGIKNIYDKEGLGKNTFTFFFPGYLNRAGCYDKNGNSDITKALILILKDRYITKYGTSDILSITKRIAEIPITPLEAIIRTLNNLFPVTQLNERLNLIDNLPNFYNDTYIGNLILNKKGEVEFYPSNDIPIRDFPLKDNKAKGAIEIFQMPEKNKEGKVYSNRYILGHDPVDDDLANTMSLTSTFVLDLFTDKIVAEYTGRLAFAEDNYEIVRLLCLFYNGKCLYEAHPYSEKVYTPNGIKLWKDVKIGDTLFSPTKGIVKVINIPIDKEMDIYKITLSDGRIIYSSDNHIWLIYKGTSKETTEITTIQMLKEGIKNKWNLHNFFIPEHNGVEYCNKNLLIDPYTMGLILSEGCLINNHCFKNGIQISSSKEDMLFYKTVVPYNIKYIGKTGVSWHVYINNCKNIMKNYNLLNTNSHTKFIPNDYLYSDRNLRIELLKGLMDGDGCATNNGASIFITCSKQLANNVLSLARSLGIKAWLQTSRKNVYRVALASKFKIFKLPRKVNKQHIYKPYLKGSKATAILNKTAIINIEYSHKEMGKCITVDSDDGLYLIGDYVTTHNCNKKGIFSYFSKMNCTHLLADTPEYLRDKQLIKAIGYGNTSKGVSATLPINNYANQLIRDWLLKPVPSVIEEDGEEKEITIPNLYLIKNRALIKELILFNPDINVDRVRALGLLMLYREEKMILYNGDVKNKEMNNNTNYLGNDDFFKNNYDLRFKKI